MKIKPLMDKRDVPLQGKTYSLYGDDTETDHYYKTIKNIADTCLYKCPDSERLLVHVQRAGNNRAFLGKFSARNIDRSLISFLKKILKDSLPLYTRAVKHHLRHLSLSERLDSTLGTNEENYHFYMLEIELLNRIYKKPFKTRKYKFALLAHCLRDFRPECQSVSGDIESLCRECTEECFINIGSHLLKKHHIHPLISTRMDLEKLFKQLKAEHPSIGALGIACIPELVNGMRLCLRLDIPAVGIPLDANRCARWMKQAYETTFNLKELEELLK
jgi:hypothetical protein